VCNVIPASVNQVSTEKRLLATQSHASNLQTLDSVAFRGFVAAMQRSLTPSTKVRILVPQPLQSKPYVSA
jgi:hypothetical protein